MSETTDINELFNRDPLSLTDEDITSIIAEMRKKRHMFKTAPAAGKTKAPAKLTEKQKQVSSLKIDLEL